MTASRPFSNALELLRAAHLRPTRQRLVLVRLLFEQGDRDVTGEAVEAAVRVSLATVYNTLHQFIEAGLLREVVIEPGRSYFDTNVSDHHHFFFEDTGILQDIPGDLVRLALLPAAPHGTSDNLRAAIAGETHEYTDMYPGMARTARQEGFDEIADWFETLAKAEKSHAGRFQRALDGLE